MATPTDRATLETLAATLVGQMVRQVDAALPDGIGFALLVFDFGGKGNLAYASNGQREDMLQALREFLEKHDAGQVRSVFGGLRS